MRGTIGSLTVGGSILGGVNHNAYILAGGLAGGLGGGLGAKVGAPALKSLIVKHSVERASIVAGYSATLDVQNTEAGIGSITIGGNLVGSEIMAGSDKGSDGRPGTQDDGTIIGSLARIDSVKIGGAFTGLPGDTTRFFYIQAPLVKKATIGKATYTHAELAPNLHFDAIGIAAILSLS